MAREENIKFKGKKHFAPSNYTVFGTLVTKQIFFFFFAILVPQLTLCGNSPLPSLLVIKSDGKSQKNGVNYIYTPIVRPFPPCPLFNFLINQKGVLLQGKTYEARTLHFRCRMRTGHLGHADTPGYVSDMPKSVSE